MNTVDTSTTAGKIAVMQAYEKGADITVMNHGQRQGGTLNKSSYSFPAWDWQRNDYRIKSEPPKPRLRAWYYNEIPLGAVIRHSDARSSDLILGVAQVSCAIITGIGMTIDLDHALSKYEWCWPHEQFDDKWRPCGVED